ncbi:rod shape-determining protein [Lachnoclostridium sp. Marseille-P6806]|uniref:rod shape-determining protein n=1 Tax=Lachnoclostridium sp. Marseille-P6806 TaxID=2364793 RepID=UPI00102FA79D|nr:rod shape-determining protein [Lachnoclostridium sp. Marseille-P6806]
MIYNTFAVDLGTNNIKIYNSAADRISVQKNMIAVENRKNMIAFGDSAYEMYEKAPASIHVSRPISCGVIADIQNMEKLMKSFVSYEFKGAVRPADYFIAIPTDVTEVERRAFYDLIRDAGIRAKKIMGVEKAIADGLGMGIDVKNSQGVMIVDVGYDTTEISILSLGGIVLSRLIKVGGHVFDNSIVGAVRREFNLVIGTKTAEGVRISLHELGENEGLATVYGRDIVTGLPVERTLSHEFVSASLKENFRTIVDNIKVVLERTPPELSADIYRHGLFLTGGACQEEGLAEAIAEEVRLRVNVAESPINTCAIGLSQVIKKQNYRSLAYTIEGMGRR